MQKFLLDFSSSKTVFKFPRPCWLEVARDSCRGIWVA